SLVPARTTTPSILAFTGGAEVCQASTTAAVARNAIQVVGKNYDRNPTGKPARDHSYEFGKLIRSVCASIISANAAMSSSGRLKYTFVIIVAAGEGVAVDADR